MKRRDFLKSATTTGAGLLILPKTMLAGAGAPSNKLNLALIGTWGRGSAHFGEMSSENVVALCDVNEDHMAVPPSDGPTPRRTSIGASASTRKASMPSSAARPTSPTRSSPTGR